MSKTGFKIWWRSCICWLVINTILFFGFAKKPVEGDEPCVLLTAVVPYLGYVVMPVFGITFLVFISMIMYRYFKNDGFVSTK